MARVDRLRRESRPQNGYFQIILNSNFQVNIFEDDAEVMMFIDSFNKFAREYSARMLGCSMMDTHIHILLYAIGLSSFIQKWIRIFSRYHNKRLKTSGNIFVSPFQSYYYGDGSNVMKIIETLFYLYYNPLAEGMCSHPKEYARCSFSSHYEKTHIDLTKQPYILPSRPAYNIDSSLLYSIYPTYDEFEKAFWEYTRLKKQNSKGVGLNGRMTEMPAYAGNGYKPYSKQSHNTDSQVLEYRNKILNGKLVMHLSSKEADDIIRRLLTETFANRRQIASVMMVSYEHVRGIERKMVFRR